MENPMKRPFSPIAALLVIFSVATYVPSQAFADGNQRSSKQQKTSHKSQSSRGGQKKSSKSSQRGGKKATGKTASMRVWGDPHEKLNGPGASGNRKPVSGKPSSVQRKWIPLEGIEHMGGKKLFSHSDEQRNAFRPGAPTPREVAMPWLDHRPGGGATGLFSHAEDQRSGYRSGVLTPREAATGSLTTRPAHQTTSPASLPTQPPSMNKGTRTGGGIERADRQQRVDNGDVRDVKRTQESNEGGGIWNIGSPIDFEDFESRRHILPLSTSQFGKGRGTPSASAFVDSVRTAREKGSALRKNK
jgi:hypothetical protein